MDNELDITRIKENLYAMGMLWKQRTEKQSNRNNIQDLANYMKEKYPENFGYIIYNLTFNPLVDIAKNLEDEAFQHFPFPIFPRHQNLYETSMFRNLVVSPAFPYQQMVMPLRLMINVVYSILIFLATKQGTSDNAHDADIETEAKKRLPFPFNISSNSNAVYIHCNNGRGKTALLFSCLLRVLNYFPSADDAFEYFIERRTEGDRSLVTVSSKRFLKIFDELFSKFYKSVFEPETVLKPLVNEKAEISIKKIYVNLGWNENVTENMTSKIKDFRLGLELFEKGRFINEKVLALKDGKDLCETLEFDFSLSEKGDHSARDVVVKDDFVIKIVLKASKNENVHVSGVTEINIILASYYSHTAFIGGGRKIIIKSTEMEVTGYGHAMAHKLGGSSGILGWLPIGKIGDQFEMAIELNNEESEVVTEYEVFESNNTCLAFHKLIMNGIPSFDENNKCFPILELWESDKMDGNGKRTLLYSTTLHRMQLQEIYSVQVSQIPSVSKSPSGSEISQLDISFPRLSGPSRSTSLDNLMSFTYNEVDDPVYFDEYMALFRLCKIETNIRDETPLVLNRTSSYLLKIFHLDNKTGAKIPILKYDFQSSLMAPGLIRIRPFKDYNQSETETQNDISLSDGGISGSWLELADFDDERKFPTNFSIDLIFSELESPDIKDDNSESSKQELIERSKTQSDTYVSELFSKFSLVRAIITFVAFHAIKPNYDFLDVLCTQTMTNSFYNFDLNNLKALDDTDDYFEEFEWLSPKLKQLISNWYIAILEKYPIDNFYHPLVVAFGNCFKLILALIINNNDIQESHLFLTNGNFPTELYSIVVKESFLLKKKWKMLYVPVVSALYDEKNNEPYSRPTTPHSTKKENLIDNATILDPPSFTKALDAKSSDDKNKSTEEKDNFIDGTNIPPPPPMPTISQSGLMVAPVENQSSLVVIPPPPPPPPMPLGSSPIAVSERPVSRKQARVTLHWNMLRKQDVETIQQKRENRKTIWNELNDFTFDDDFLSKLDDQIDKNKFEELFCVDPEEKQNIKEKQNIFNFKSSTAAISSIDLNYAKTIGIVVSRFERLFRNRLEKWVKKNMKNDLDAQLALQISRLIFYRQLRLSLKTGKIIFPDDGEDYKMQNEDYFALLTLLPNSPSDISGLSDYIRKLIREWDRNIGLDIFVASKLETTDLFVYEFLMKEPNAKIILFCRTESLKLFGNENDGELQVTIEKLQKIKSSCEQLRNLKSIKFIMRTVLNLGNMTNQEYGRRVTAKAYGFRLDSLLKLKDVKGRDGKTTLMTYLVEILWGIPEFATIKEDFDFLKEVVGLSTLDLCDTINGSVHVIRDVESWKQVETDSFLVDALKLKLKNRDYWTDILNEASPDISNLYSQMLSGFISTTLTELKSKIKAAKDSFKEMWKIFYDVALYFGEDPDEYDNPVDLNVSSKIILRKPASTPEKLFGIFLEFIQQYDDAVNVMRRTKERERKEKEKRSKKHRNLSNK